MPDDHDAPELEGARAQTRRRLLDVALALAADGRIPAIAKLAAAAGVSRATAYRCFRSRAELVEAIMEESLGPVRLFEPAAADGAARVRELFDQTFPRFKEFEPQMRAALQLSLEHMALDRGGALAEPAYRRGFRRGILRRAAGPLAERLGPERFELLLRALSVVYGIEPYVILRDIWGLDDAAVEATARFVVEALLAHAARAAEG